MNNSSIYDRRLFKETFKKIYNDKNNNFNFPINNNFLSNIITKWKNKSIKFKKECVLYDTTDRENRLILGEFRSIPVEGSNRAKQIKNEYIIWRNTENIMRLRVCKNIFLYATFHHPRILSIVNFNVQRFTYTLKVTCIIYLDEFKKRIFI